MAIVESDPKLGEQIVRCRSDRQLRDPRLILGWSQRPRGIRSCGGDAGDGAILVVLHRPAASAHHKYNADAYCQWYFAHISLRLCFLTVPHLYAAHPQSIPHSGALIA